MRGDPCAAATGIVVDYGYSATSYVLPLLLGPLGVEAVSAHGFAADGSEPPTGLREAVGQAKRLVSAIGADLGVVFDRAGERLFLIDEQAREIPVEQALLLFLRLIGLRRPAGQARLPDHGHEPCRRAGRGQRARGDPDARLARRADEGRGRATASIFAGAVGGGYVFPEFLPGLRRGREPLQAARAARAGRPAALGARLRAAGEHARPPAGAVPLVAEGAVMRVLTERLRGPRRRPAWTGSRSSTSAAGRSCCPTRRAARPHLRRGRDARRPRPSSRRSSARIVEEIMQTEGADTPRPLEPQAKVDPSGAFCLTGAPRQRTKGSRGTVSGSRARSPTPTSSSSSTS